MPNQYWLAENLSRGTLIGETIEGKSVIDCNKIAGAFYDLHNGCNESNWSSNGEFFELLVR